MNMKAKEIEQLLKENSIEIPSGNTSKVYQFTEGHLQVVAETIEHRLNNSN